MNGFKVKEDGVRLVQTDATMNPGNSGSPAIDSTGRAIGLATFTLSDPDSTEQSQNLNFIVPIEAAQPFLKELRIEPRQSTFTTHYLDGPRQYEAGKTKQALEILRPLSDQHPDIVAVRELVKERETLCYSKADQWVSPPAAFLAEPLRACWLCC